MIIINNNNIILCMYVIQFVKQLPLLFHCTLSILLTDVCSWTIEKSGQYWNILCKSKIRQNYGRKDSISWKSVWNSQLILNMKKKVHLFSAEKNQQQRNRNCWKHFKWLCWRKKVRARKINHFYFLFNFFFFRKEKSFAQVFNIEKFQSRTQSRKQKKMREINFCNIKFK